MSHRISLCTFHPACVGLSGHRQGEGERARGRGVAVRRLVLCDVAIRNVSVSSVSSVSSRLLEDQRGVHHVVAATLAQVQSTHMSTWKWDET